MVARTARVPGKYFFGTGKRCKQKTEKKDRDAEMHFNSRFFVDDLRSDEGVHESHGSAGRTGEYQTMSFKHWEGRSFIFLE